jgi:hypothetical protein
MTLRNVLFGIGFLAVLSNAAILILIMAALAGFLSPIT